MRGYEAVWEWANDLCQQAGSRFRCRYRDKRYHVIMSVVGHGTKTCHAFDDLSSAFIQIEIEFGFG